MGISHKYKLIYISIPRCGSQSIASILSNSCDSFHSLHEHLTYIELLLLLDEKHFYSYTSFTVVRNPYDRFQSMYYEYIKIYSKVSFYEFIDIVKSFYKDSNFIENTPLFLMPQSYFCTYNGSILVDIILKLELLNKSWLDFINKNIDNIYWESTIFTIPHVNSSNKSEKIIYTSEVYTLINKLYYNDFINFDYSLIE